MSALRVVADDHRPVADAEVRHHLRELGRAEEHPAWMTRRGWGSRKVARPAQIDRAGQMIAEVLRVHVLVEAEAAVDYTHIRVAHAGGDVVGGPEKVRPRERGHERHSIRVSLAGPSARRKVSMRIVVVTIAVAALLVSTGFAGAAKTIGAPPVQFARANLAAGTVSGVVQSGGVLTLAKIGLTSGTYDDP